MKPLVAIENEDIADLGIAEDVFRFEGVPVETVRAWKSEGLPSLDEVSALVPLGGDMNVDQVAEYPYLAEERALLAKAVDRDVPVLGICLGGQLLARALGAPVHPAPIRELGFVPLRLTEEGRRDPVLSALREGDRMFQWHVDAFDLPPGAALLATGEDVPNQAFRAGRRAWGVQFHPEVSAEEVDRWLDAVPDVERTYGRRIDELREEISRELGTMHHRSRDLFRRFARVLA